jgi:N-acetylneuraminic acid mutarotase
MSPFGYDSESDKIIMYGGLDWEAEDLDDHHNDTWVYDCNSDEWQKMASAFLPPRRGGHSLAYNNDTDRVLLFGGINTGGGPTAVQWNDTWAYDYNSDQWTNRSPDVSPSGRALAAMVYDSESEVMIIFGGGLDGFEFTDQTWAYDYNENNWTQMNPSSSPSVRVAQMAYDVESDRIILFGGAGRAGDTGPMSTYTDTWAYDYNSDKWTEMAPVEHPASIGVLTYDVESDKVVMFGGSTTWYAPETDLITETWTYHYNTNTWTQMSPSVEPQGRFAPAMAYDSESDRAVLFSGGWYVDGLSFNALNDTWAYDYNSDIWQIPPIATPIPSSTEPPPPPPFPWELILIVVGGFAVVIVVAVVVKRFIE